MRVPLIEINRALLCVIVEATAYDEQAAVGLERYHLPILLERDSAICELITRASTDVAKR